MKGKKVCCFMLMVILAFSTIQFSFGLSVAEGYNYGMQLSYSDGNKLPPAPIKISDLLGKQLHLRVNNNTDTPDRFMLLCFLDGTLIPYEINGKKDKDMQFQIDAKGIQEIDFTLALDTNYLYEESIIYIITVGQLDIIPKDSMDYYDLFSCGIAITIDETDRKGETRNIENTGWAIFPLTNIDADGMYAYYQSAYDNQSEMGKTIVYGNVQEGYDLNIAVLGNNQEIALLLFVDNQPYFLDGEKTDIVFAANDKLYSKTVHLELSEGTHSIYYVYMSLDCNMPDTWNTNKLSVVITK